MKKKTRTC